ncbi:hypothetical protein, partial [Pseudomonas fluorescens]|uniref:hypothetical protein n=1 Tax=Pseudomonas fluorescens TaxID=294 RepID=UPI0018C5C0E5
MGDSPEEGYGQKRKGLGIALRRDGHWLGGELDDADAGADKTVNMADQAIPGCGQQECAAVAGVNLLADIGKRQRSHGQFNLAFFAKT